MTSPATQSAKFHPAIIAIHWLTFLLIIAAYALMEFKGVFPKDSPERAIMKSLHFSIGISVLLLSFIRIVIRFMTKVPPIVPEPPAKQQLLAKLVHVALYGFMIGLPLIGILLVNSHGHGAVFWGVELPALIGEDKSLGHLFHEMHETVANLGYLLIGAHAAAGIYHHHKMKDNTLLRMSFLKK